MKIAILCTLVFAWSPLAFHAMDDTNVLPVPAPCCEGAGADCTFGNVNGCQAFCPDGECVCYDAWCRLGFPQKPRCYC